MDRITRKALKTDKFAAEVGHTVEFLEEHRKPAIIIVAVVLVAVGAAAFTYYHLQSRHAERQQVLREALRTYEAQVSPEPNPFVATFETAELKDEAVSKAFNELVAEYPGSDEAMIATFYQGVVASDKGNLEEAETFFKEVIDSGKEVYASQAALSLSWVYAGMGRIDEAEQLLRGLMEQPTMLVSKEQATISLASLLASSKPEEARKLLEPLRTERGAVSRAALTALSALPESEQ